MTTLTIINASPTTVRITGVGAPGAASGGGGGGGAPDPHAASHQDGGSDELALDGSQITTGTVADARIASTIARDSEVTAAVAAHEADTTNVHGIADTTALATTSAVTSAISAHEADTTAVHGIANTANLVLTNDSRLSDARTPTAHAASHQDGGADELALDGSQITTGTVADARIASTIARDSEVTSAVAALSTVYQPLDSDLTAIAALSTTSYGRAFLALADQAALVALLPSYQPLDSDLTALAALTTTAYGRAVLELANQAALMALLSSASTTAEGKVELATTAEATAQSDTVRAVTPAGLADRVLNTRSISTTAPLSGGGDLSANRTLTVGAASDTATGVVELATTTEAATGTDTTRAVTAAGVHAAVPVVAQTLNAQTGTTYTIVLGDVGKLVTLTNAGAITVTLPQDSSVAVPVGTRIDFAVLGAGMATWVAGSGATVNATPSAVSRAQYSSVSAVKRAANTWLLVGDLA